MTNSLSAQQHGFKKNMHVLNFRSDPLNNGECLLILCDFFPDVPGNSGCVLAHWLEYVTGHIFQVDTWTVTQKKG